MPTQIWLPSPNKPPLEQVAKIIAPTTDQARFLITGENGFVGHHALLRWPTAKGLADFCTQPDVCNKASLLDCIRQFKPDFVLHLAALSYVPDSFRAPRRTFEVNFLGTLNLLEALSESGFEGRLLYVSSGDIYGAVQENALPITESQPLRPRNPYAVSKVASEALCFQWSQISPFEIVLARPFNHIGSGQSPMFAVSDFARQIAEIKAGHRAPILQVGDVDVTRDFADVSDILEGYDHLLRFGLTGEAYNVCSGIERSLRSVIETLLSVANVKAEIAHDAQRFRRSEQRRVCGSHQKLSQLAGWHGSVSIEKTLFDLFCYWERVIGK